MRPGQGSGSRWIQRTARHLRSLLFAGFAIAYLATWIEPTLLGPRMLRLLVFYVILEAMAVLANAGLFIPGEGSSKLKTSLMGLFSVGGMTAMAALVAIDFGVPWALVPFVVSLASRGIELWGASDRQGGRDRVRLQFVATVLVFMGTAMFTFFGPMPRLGVTDAIIEAQGFDQLDASSDFFGEPEKALAFGTVYFLGLALAELYKLPERLGEWETTGKDG